MEISNERIGYEPRRRSRDIVAKKLGCADAKGLPRYAGGVISQKNRHTLSCMAFFASLSIVLFIQSEAFAWQAGATPSTQASISTPAKDELRISARAYHEDLVLKVADLKSYASHDGNRTQRAFEG
jgi:hypothetical protein